MPVVLCSAQNVADTILLAFVITIAVLAIIAIVAVALRADFFVARSDAGSPPPDETDPAAEPDEEEEESEAKRLEAVGDDVSAVRDRVVVVQAVPGLPKDVAEELDAIAAEMRVESERLRGFDGDEFDPEDVADQDEASYRLRALARRLRIASHFDEGMPSTLVGELRLCAKETEDLAQRIVDPAAPKEAPADGSAPDDGASAS